jgi:hypothetical protein
LKMFAETDKRIEKKFAETRATSEKEWQEIKESQKETDKLLKELAEDRKETDKILTEKFAETDRIVKELSKNIGGISNSNGKMAEDMIYNTLNKDKTFAGIKFNDIDKNMKLNSKFLNLKGEFDVVLKNGDTIGIIETKYKVEKDDISELVEKKTTNFRKLFPMFSDYKIILGIGGMSFEDEAITEAKENGIGIIKISGDTVEYYTENLKTY